MNIPYYIIPCQMADNTSWDKMMAETHEAVKKLGSIFNSLLNKAILIKNGRGSLREVENLLDQTLPVTEVDRRLAFYMSFMADSKRVRHELVSFLFKTHQACLLLLVDGNAIETALGLSFTHKVWIDKDNHYRVTPIGGAPSHVVQILDNFENPHRHNRGRRNCRGQARAVSPTCGRPVMSMEECQIVLDKLTTDVDKLTTDVDKLPVGAQENSYLAVLTCGRTVKCLEGAASVTAASEAVAPGAVIAASEAVIAAPEAVIAAPIKLSWADMVNESSSEEPPPSTAPCRPASRGNNRRPVNKK